MLHITYTNILKIFYIHVNSKSTTPLTKLSLCQFTMQLKSYKILKVIPFPPHPLSFCYRAFPGDKTQ